MLDHQPLDLWALMRAVAQRGGYQAVSALRFRLAVLHDLSSMLMHTRLS